MLFSFIVAYFTITSDEVRVSARRNFSGGSEVHQGRACKGVRRVGVPGAGGLQKIVKNQ